MLFRIVDHFRDNPKRIDKLIAIKGLPREWIFQDTPDGHVMLKRPWEPDIDKNIPYDIRHLCEPVYVTFKYSPIEKGSPGVTEMKQVLGLKIDYNSEPGREMWDRVERFVEETIPRDERIPKPVVCAKDERSPFETYMPRRTQTGSLQFEPHDVPNVDLTRYTVKTGAPEPVIPPTRIEAAKTESTPPASDFKCDKCDYRHKSKAGIRMHAMKRHPQKEEAVA